MTEATQDSPAPPRRIWDHPLIRRLPLLLVAAVGFFFLLPKVPHEVELDYDLGRAANGLTELTLEVHDAQGKALERTVLKSTTAHHAVQHLKLPRGNYEVEAKLGYPDRVERRERTFAVGDSDRVDLDLETP